MYIFKKSSETEISVCGCVRHTDTTPLPVMQSRKWKRFEGQKKMHPLSLKTFLDLKVLSRIYHLSLLFVYWRQCTSASKFPEGMSVILYFKLCLR